MYEGAGVVPPCPSVRNDIVSPGYCIFYHFISSPPPPSVLLHLFLPGNRIADVWIISVFNPHVFPRSFAIVALLF